MSTELNDKGADFHLHYCARNQSKTIQSDELLGLINIGKATIYHDNGDSSKGINLKTTLKNYDDGQHLYFCGPTGFMAAIRNETNHWPPENIHFENFSSVTQEKIQIQNFL